MIVYFLVYFQVYRRTKTSEGKNAFENYLTTVLSVGKRNNITVSSEKEVEQGYIVWGTSSFPSFPAHP